MNGQTAHHQPQLPHKLPAKQRKKLSLLISNDATESSAPPSAASKMLVDESPYYIQPHNLTDYYAQQSAQPTHQSESSLQMSNDTYLSLDWENEPAAAGDTYYLLDDCYSRPVATSSSSTEDDDDESYYVPFGLRTDSETTLEKIEEEKEMAGIEDEEESVGKIGVTRPKLPKKMNKSELTRTLTLKHLMRAQTTRGDSAEVEAVIAGLDQFRSAIFKNESNRTCADCGRAESDWMSCRLFITLCRSCAGR